MKVPSYLRKRMDESLWLIPSAMVLGSIMLSLLTTVLDDVSEGRPFSEVVFTGGPDSARVILQTVASAVITFTGLVFTITIIALQLSSQQFSPRVLRTFLRDRHSKFALGTFVATFIYCLMVLRVLVTAGDRGVTIPSISMMVLLVLVLASVAMFVSYISHMANSIRVSHIVTAVGDETRALIERLPEPDASVPMDRSLLNQPTSVQIAALHQGTLTEVDNEGLVELATGEGLAFELVRSVGDFLAAGQVVLEVKGGEVDTRAVWKHLSLSRERTMSQDVHFGLRQLVDVAEKALSPSMNDPTTAVMALDQIHDVLRRLATMPFTSGEHADEEGVVRLVVQPLEWEPLVELAFSEIRHFSGSSMQVIRRMLAALEDLEEAALPERKLAPRSEAELVRSMISESFDRARDQQAAHQPDHQGIGSRQ